MFIDHHPRTRSSAVDIAQVINVDDIDPFEFFVHGIDDSVAATAGTSQTSELATQWTADSQRRFGQWTEDELHARCANLLWELKEITFGASGDMDRERLAHQRQSEPGARRCQRYDQQRDRPALQQWLPEPR